MDFQKAFNALEMEPKAYAKKIALPIVSFGFIFSILVYVLLPDLFTGNTQIIPALIPVICIFFAFYYPFTALGSKAAQIDNNMHYYITQMGAISTAETPRLDIIKIVSKNDSYKFLAKESEKIYNLVTVWNMSLSDACRFVSKRTPSILYEDFLDRFAHGLQSGEDIKSFLAAEQNVVMNEYESMYNGALYAIEVIKELFVSLIMALIFLASFAVIMPILTGMDAILLMSIVVVVFVVTDIVMITFTRSKVPKDPIWQQTKITTKAKIKLYQSIPISLAGCIIVAIAVMLYGKLELPIAVAAVMTPLVYTGHVAKKIEKDIKRKDENYPSFIRSLGSSAGARGGLIDEALRSLRIHDFGPLTKDVNALFKRINTRVDKTRSWDFFSANTGSNLIQRFSAMFVEATNLGGQPEVIGDMIATNFHRIVNLRKKRYQSASSLVGVLYGLTAGIGFTLYIALGVVGLMQDMFTTISMPEGMGMGMILSTEIGNLELLSAMVLFIMISHSLMSALLIRFVDGGHILCSTTDFVIMSWISAFSAVFTTSGVASLLGTT
ncbi:flagellar protein FlaJ [Methanococcoides vulcani]|uniref:Flagellar protein FlaJ n=1 Tax=Methanococcoides vulcani TaxID=1353158 RepID=A0A1I0AN32_9EURY|nr:archaellar assembly protein FlaJ [Methanococcoides vulcani]SES95764.1 flagellar protein FlaJ [Methanococcoides vulcani]